MIISWINNQTIEFGASILIMMGCDDKGQIISFTRDTLRRAIIERIDLNELRIL